MTNKNKTPGSLANEDLKTQEKLQGKLKEADFPEMKQQVDAALGEEE